MLFCDLPLFFTGYIYPRDLPVTVVHVSLSAEHCIFRPFSFLDSVTRLMDVSLLVRVMNSTLSRVSHLTKLLAILNALFSILTHLFHKYIRQVVLLQFYIFLISEQQLGGLSPRTNYTNRATAACQ
jgi:hypothetical protein